MAKKLALLVLIAAVVAAWFGLDGQRFISVGFFQEAYRSDPLRTAGIFFLIYFFCAAFSLPAAAVLTVIAGMIFGLVAGTVLVSFASSLGATAACLMSRHLLRDWVRRRLAGYLQRIDQGVARDGALYLFTLRLIPVFPFWVINLAFGLTRLSLPRFYLVSQLGMLAGTAVYVNAGAQLGAVEEFSLRGVLTPGVLGSLVLLGIFPFLARAAMGWWRRRALYAAWPKPRVFDTNLIIIGAGSGGLVTAYIAAAVKARVTLIEKHLMGGDCLNTGCVPSKALLRAAKAAHEVSTAADLGVDAGPPRVDFARVMAHVHGAVRAIEPHDSVARYTALGVDCVSGAARLVSPWTVAVAGRTISAPRIVIATGASPRVPELPGLAELDYLTSDNLWSLTALPEQLLILGGGPVGCEMAQAFQRLGSQVTLVQRPPRLLPREDPQASELIAARLAAEGVRVLTSWEVTAFARRGGQTVALARGGQEHLELPCDRVLVALGRRAHTEGLGLDTLGIVTRDDGTVEVDAWLRTRYPNIFACGDVCGPFQYTHASSHQAWYAAVNALFGGLRKFRVDHRLMPSVVYTDPEVASVGINEHSAREQGVACEITCYDLADLDRAITDRAGAGLVKVFTAPGRDRILGATIVAARGGEMLGEFVAAMKHGKGLNSILATIHPYPGYSEANKMAAGQWQRAHAPRRLLRWVEKYHRWQLRP